jgi:hypothetical protein
MCTSIGLYIESRILLGAETTGVWGIDKRIKKDVLYDGYRFKD